MFETRCFACANHVLVRENPPEFLPLCERCQHALTAKHLKKPFSVRVAAAALRWPGFCACCGTKANALHRVTQDKSAEAKDGLHRDKHTWEIPYCHHCVEHVKYQKEANDVQHHAAEEVKRASKKFEQATRKEGKTTARPILIGVSWGFLILVLGAGLFNTMVLKLLFAPDAGPGELLGPWLAIVSIFLVSGILLGVFLSLMGLRQELAQGKRRVDKAARRLEEAQQDYQRAQTYARNTQAQAQSHLQPTCSAQDVAVHYIGWEGYTHVFQFESESYAVAFVSMNHGNVAQDAGA
jgi:hypothetical protein